MKAHEAASRIPDPHTSPRATCLTVLWDHYEILKNTERFFSLSTYKNAASEIMTGGIRLNFLTFLLKKSDDDRP